MVEAGLAAPFDGAAADYDLRFSDTDIGGRLRRAVWRELAPLLKPGMAVLDLGCGTGEDAVWLAQRDCRVIATDPSTAMLRRVGEKSAGLGLGGRIATQRLDLDRHDGVDEFGGRFDLILSNFGAINCVGDISAMGRDLNRWAKPGGIIALNVMGRFCAWEFFWYLLHLRAAAWRRVIGTAGAKIAGTDIDVHYWGVGQLRRALAPGCRLVRVRGIGVTLPPSYLFHLFDNRPKLLDGLARWERRLSANPVCAQLADHSLVILQRRAT